mmetsp:Transcript_19666/g.57808  ORF Transcript_19666/g.57808 Transcript_19666/m.57808 type:complete len:222 (+) Transcript_19666:443-1108(+)
MTALFILPQLATGKNQDVYFCPLPTYIARAHSHYHTPLSARERAQHCGPHRHPVVWVSVGGHVDGDHKVGRLPGGGEHSSPDGRLVQRALVVLLAALKVRRRHKVDDGQRVVHDGRPRVGELPLLAVPPRAVEEEAVDVDAVLRRGSARGSRLLCSDLVREGERVDRDGIAACVHLQDASHEALREEEGRDPKGRRWPRRQPRAHEVEACNHVLVPRAQRL